MCFIVRGGALGIHWEGQPIWLRCGAECGGGVWEGTVPLALCWLSVTSAAIHKQIGPFWCWFPGWVGGWFCVCSGPPWVSPTNSPVRLGVSPTTANPTDFYSQRFWDGIFLCWKRWVVQPVLLPSSSFRFICSQMLDLPVHQPLHHSSQAPAPASPSILSLLSSQLTVSTPPTSLDECLSFNSLVVGLPYSSIFWQFWLFFVLKFVVLLLVMRGSKVYLPMPPSWPEGWSP